METLLYVAVACLLIYMAPGILIGAVILLFVAAAVIGIFWSCVVEALRKRPKAQERRLRRDCDFPKE
jgi:ABC-type uncharacterized transport system permease subunit